ncbi:hypothetical protein EST38_g5522 [Candolleomyces aberdarensis]|uniref:Carrier domain-containing protein n=1 Tax=Candolleomyces aberdarensis TaxID=2316362 RepID=A0A4Q2DMA5_9AGAR|nr:hypothetical protein EST38_g5522 [Candolleomyces aberdarensis]
MTLGTLPSKPTVVAILAVVDQLSYFSLIAGIIRAGYCAFPISPRNSDAAVANLLQKSGAAFMLVSHDKPMQKLAQAASQLLDRDMPFMDIPSFQEIYEQAEITEAPPSLHSKSDETALILHSSGSTSFPKPIYLSHRNLLQWGLQPWYGEVDLSGRILSNHALPFFHAMGVVSLCWAMTTGVTLSNFAPKSPPHVPTPESMFESIVATKSQLLFCVPTFLEEWAQNEEKVAYLKGLDAILFGGAPIHKQTGDALHEQGVKLYPFYGALPQPIHLPYSTPKLKTTKLRLTIRMTYSADDQIMHSTGEKTNPGPIETIIRRHPKVNCAIVFGRGRFQAGVLVEPSSLGGDGNFAREAFIDEIWQVISLLPFHSPFPQPSWPQIEEANRIAPSHSRIFKEMVILSSPGKPFQYTAKGSPRRQVVIDMYEKEINDLYDGTSSQCPMAEASGASTGSPEDVDLSSVEGCTKLVRKVFGKSLRLEEGEELKDDDDILQLGCDSLQAIWIRNEILSSISRHSETAPKSKALACNFVYSYPTVSSLALHIHDKCAPRVDGESSGPDETEDEKTLKKMRDLVEKYSRDFPVHEPQQTPELLPPSTREVVLLTGSTGGLGSYLLESLVLKPDIVKVYVLNRPHATVSSATRQLDSFKERGIDPNFLDFSKIKFLEGDLAAPENGFGLQEEGMFEELRKEVTCIMHTAWRVDFNVGISSMEPLIAGTRNLIDFALSSQLKRPPRFIFASSIGVLRNFPGTVAPEASFPDPSIALGSGYPESKWVAEQVLTRARESTTLEPVIVRIGQLSGGRNGYWGTSDPGLISWFPVHTAASALTDIRACSDPFLHFVHPAPIPWNDMVELLSEALLVPQVCYSDWLGKLEACQSLSQSEIESNPALKLLEFYQSVSKLPPVSDNAEAFGFPHLSTTLAAQRARSLHPPVLQPLDRKDVAAWLSYWNEEGTQTVFGAALVSF